jgi:hypothetical protein
VRRFALAALCGVALAGCGSGSSSGSSPSGGSGKATVWVTRGRGAVVLHSGSAPAGESALQALDRLAHVTTRFGGRYVRGVDGVEEHGQRSWFYYVNGYLADRSAADYRLRADDLVWWDYRPWRDPAQDPVVVGAFPQPFLGGYDGRRRRTVIVTADATPVQALARRLHATVASSGVGMVAREVNVISIDAGGGPRASIDFAGSRTAGAPVRMSFRGDPRVLLRPRPFRYRYEVDG